MISVPYPSLVFLVLVRVYLCVGDNFGGESIVATCLLFSRLSSTLHPLVKVLAPALVVQFVEQRHTSLGKPLHLLAITYRSHTSLIEYSSVDAGTSSLW